MRILTCVLLLFSCDAMAQDEEHPLGIMGVSEVLCLEIFDGTEVRC